MNIEAIERAIAYFGNQSRMSKACGVKQTLISDALLGRKNFGPETCLKVARATSGQVKARELRPDIDWEAAFL